MMNRDIYQRDPHRITLLNNGVATVNDARTDDERRTLRFELEHFVCEGQYRSGLVRILETYLQNQGQPEQPAAWISGFYGSGKSHLAKMLRFLWDDLVFPEDGATARGLARLPDDVTDLLAEISTLGRRGGGLRAAAGTMGSGAGESVRLALLNIVFKSAGLPAGYPQARFCLWLKRQDIYDRVRDRVAAEGVDFDSELNDLYVSPLIAKAVLEEDAHFASDEIQARAALRQQFPKPADITTDDFISVMQATLAPDGQIPCTIVILDEVQQYIGDDANLSYIVQEAVEACSKRFGDRLLFVGTGQTALSGTPALQRLQGRFTVNVELSDRDVETVTRRVVLAKRQDRVDDVTHMLEANAGEIARHLSGSAIAARTEDQTVLKEDYPLLPVRRRFWEQVLRAVDRAGTTGQLRTQLRIVYDAIRATADDPLGTVVPADFLFDDLANSLLRSGVLLRELNETITTQDDGTDDGMLKKRLCALVFLIRKLPRDPGVDIGVRANISALADLLVRDLATDGATLRSRLPVLLDDLTAAGTLIKIDDEYSLQTRESSDWEAEFRNRQSRLLNDVASMSQARAELLGNAMRDPIVAVRPMQGSCKEPRRLHLHFGQEPPPDGGHDIPVWIRDGWGVEERNVLSDARSAGPESPILHVFMPKSSADDLSRLVSARGAAADTLDFKGIPSTPEGIEARKGMETRREEAANQLRALARRIASNARVFQGGGNERTEAALADKVREASHASLARLFPEFTDADHTAWPKVIERSRAGDEHPLEVLDYTGKTEDHPVCAAVLAFIGSGKKGRDVRSHFSDPPYGWPRDAIDGALIALFSAGHVRASTNGAPVPPRQFDQGKVPTADFRVEAAVIDTAQRLRLRKLFQTADVDCKPNEEAVAAGRLLERLDDLARGAGGDAPLPMKPDTAHVVELRALTGNEQLAAMLGRYDELTADLDAWRNAGALARERMPAFERTTALARHAEGLDIAAEVKPQIDAIITNRSLLEPADPVPGIATALTSALRTTLAQEEARYTEIFDEERQRLHEADSWQQIGQQARNEILTRLQIAEKVPRGDTGTEVQVLASLDRISLDGWRTRTAALPQLFADARAEADKLVEPKVRHVKLTSATLRTPEDVRKWMEANEKQLLDHIRQGPVVIN